MKEADDRRLVVNALKELHAFAVENPARAGTPDINYMEGWIEMKRLDRWPPPSEIIDIPHFTPQQRNFLEKRVRMGGHAWLLFRIRNDWLLFRGDIAARRVGHVRQNELLAIASRVWSGRLNKAELLEYLRSR